MTHDDNAKGSTRYTGHIAQSDTLAQGQSDGSEIERAPGDERLTDAQAKDKYESKE